MLVEGLVSLYFETFLQRHAVLEHPVDELEYSLVDQVAVADAPSEVLVRMARLDHVVCLGQVIILANFLGFYQRD